VVHFYFGEAAQYYVGANTDAQRLLFACPTIALTPPSPALRRHNQKETVAIEELEALRPGLDASDACGYRKALPP
jgi:hypothetical protein